MNYLPDDDLDQIVGGFVPMTIRRINGMKPPLGERGEIARAGSVAAKPPVNPIGSASTKIASVGSTSIVRGIRVRSKKDKRLL
ncbi:hypothetical protein [Legionella bononiensis]|uniref:Uncharacterized protein n=1 Tax=Legionella bononiensis TaxID=2793102 RepID=A0ABS1WCK8_9GAMM|nr:hypothetical protein [Legionella bononiensis]MBL7478927.1 hypothetical protein [Legionella bononiensis]MBL7527059.1 hypothetical protein [Legionella bononiensis]MBL7562028.1 hypothetical protein [Legionella bononiensis]